MANGHQLCTRVLSLRSCKVFTNVVCCRRPADELLAAWTSCWNCVLGIYCGCTMSLWHLLLRLVIAVIDRCASVIQVCELNSLQLLLSGQCVREVQRTNCLQRARRSSQQASLRTSTIDTWPVYSANHITLRPLPLHRHSQVRCVACGRAAPDLHRQPRMHRASEEHFPTTCAS